VNFPEPAFAERVRVMCRHLDLMIEVFGEEHGCRMFRKVAPWYAKRFGPCHEFNKRVVQVSTRAEFDGVLENYIRWRQQFLDENGELQPRFRPPPMVASFMRDPAAGTRLQPGANKFPCRKGRWKCGKMSFADAKLAEDGVEQIFRRRFADDFTDGVDGDAQIHRHEFQRRVAAQRINRHLRRRAGAVQRVLMPRVDHHLQAFRP
jgi:hypothetical protein